MAAFHKSIYHFLRSIHKRIPAKYHRFYYDYSWKIINFFNLRRKSFFKTRLTLTILEGTDTSGQFPLAVAYAGEGVQDLEYWASTILAPGFNRHVLGKKWVWQIHVSLNSLGYSCSMVICESTALTFSILSKYNGFKSTQWAGMVVDIPEYLESVWKKNKATADVLRRIRKNNLSYMIRHDLNSLDEFYYKMHVPFIKKRHKNEALIADYSMVKEFFNHGLLLFIKSGTELIAGVIVVFEKKKAVLKLLGIKDGKDEYLRLGAIGAIYYFSLLEMQKRGRKMLDVGNTRPVLTNGVTKYKMNLGTKLLPKKFLHRNRIFITLMKNTLGLRSFLNFNPFLYYKDDLQAYRALFVEGNQFERQEEFNKYFMSYQCDGLKGTSVFVFGNLDKIKSWVNLLNYDNVSVESAEPLFLE